MAPSLGVSIGYGLVGGIVGVIVIAILITIMEPKMDAVPPAIMAEHMFGDPDKKGMVMFPVFAIWGLIFGAVVSLAGLEGSFLTGAAFALLPWLVLGLVMLPKAGAGVFGTKVSKKIPVVSLIMHLIWGAIAGTVFSLLTGFF